MQSALTIHGGKVRREGGYCIPVIIQAEVISKKKNRMSKHMKRNLKGSHVYIEEIHFCLYIHLGYITSGAFLSSIFTSRQFYLALFCLVHSLCLIPGF